MMRMGLGMVVDPGAAADLHRRPARPQHAKHQPAKIAAMEAHWDGSKPGALRLFALPDEKAETQPLRDRHPGGSSLILTHDPNGLFPA